MPTTRPHLPRLYQRSRRTKLDVWKQQRIDCERSSSPWTLRWTVFMSSSGNKKICCISSRRWFLFFHLFIVCCMCVFGLGHFGLFLLIVHFYRIRQRVMLKVSGGRYWMCRNFLPLNWILEDFVWQGALQSARAENAHSCKIWLVFGFCSQSNCQNNSVLYIQDLIWNRVLDRLRSDWFDALLTMLYVHLTLQNFILTTLRTSRNVKLVLRPRSLSPLQSSLLESNDQFATDSSFRFWSTVISSMPCK